MSEAQNNADNLAEKMTKGAAEASNEGQPHKPADDREEIYFEGSPLLRAELGKLLIFGTIAAVFIALAVANWVMGWNWPAWVGIVLILAGIGVLFIPWLITKTIRYRISNYRIDFERGVLSKQIDTLELWHVEDISFHQSLLDRIVGVGTITIASHDETTPELELQGIPNSRAVFESLKQRIIAVKRQRGVVKMDIG